MERPTFVARERELEQLDWFLNCALAGEGQVCFVTGEAGSGKTALVTEFARRSEEVHEDLIIAIGNCNAQSGIGDPYLPFREVLALLTGDVEAKLTQGAITQENADRLRGFLRVSGDVVIKLGPYLIDAIVPGSKLAARVATFVVDKAGWLDRLEKLKASKQVTAGLSNLEQSNIFEQYTRVLQALAEQRPLMLVLDDLHWADTSSISLLFHLGRRIAGSRILVLGTYRPEDVALGRGSERHPLEGMLSEIKRYYSDVWVDLGQTGETASRRFVDAFLETEPNQLDEEFRQALFLHTDGHPLFTIELLRAMQERGELVLDEKGRWREGPTLEWDTLPARVEGVIEERIGRLETDLREILSVASVEGNNFTAQIISHVQEIDERQILRELSQELEKRHRLIQGTGEAKVNDRYLTHYHFTHALIQGYLYNNLSDGEQRLLHREIAAMLEELYGDRTDEIIVQLAFHYSQAEIAEKALHYLSWAADRALASYANKEAEDYYLRALDLADTDDRAELKSGLGEALFNQSRFEEAIETWREGIKLYQGSNDEGRVAWLYARCGRAAWELGDTPGGLAICQEGLASLEGAPESPGMANLLHEIARAHYFRYQIDELRTFSNQALEMAERVGAVDVYVDSLITKGIRPDLPTEEAVMILEQAIESADSAGLLYHAARAHNNLAVIKGMAGDASSELTHFQQASELARKMGNTSLELFYAANVISNKIFQGYLDEAEEELSALDELLGQANDPGVSEIRLKTERVRLLHYQGESEEAIRRSRELRHELQAIGALQHLSGNSFELGEMLIEVGEEDEAEVFILEAIELCDQSENVGRIAARSLLAMMQTKQGNFKEAHHWLDEAREREVGKGSQFFDTFWRLHAEARLAVAEKRWPEAWTAYEEYLEMMKDTRMRWYRARGLRELGEAHLARAEPGDEKRARELLLESQSEFEDMGAPIYAHQIKGLLDSLQ